MGTRVAIIERLGGHGGMDHYDFGLARGLIAAGCRVTLYTCDETEDAKIPGLKLCLPFRGIFSGNKGLRALRYAVGSIEALLRAVARREKICHFHFFHGSPEELLIVMMAVALGRKVVITVHDVESFFSLSTSRKMIHWVYTRAECIIAHNQISKTELMEKMRIPTGKIQVVSAGNNLDEVPEDLTRTQARRALGLQDAEKVILFFGHIRQVKGLDVLLRAMPETVARIPECRLLIAGRPLRQEIAHYEQLIKDLNIGPQCVLHTGFIPNEKLPLYFTAADIVALPYRRIYQSGVVLMAMSYGRAVLVSDIPGMTETIADGSNGYVFADGNPLHLAKKLIAALGNDAERETIAAAGNRYVRTFHDWEQIGRNTLEIYQQALKGN